MIVTKEESQAYQWAMDCGGTWDFPSVLRDALRHHVANELRLEFLSNPCQADDPRWNYTYDDWDKAADEALMNGGKSDE